VRHGNATVHVQYADIDITGLKAFLARANAGAITVHRSRVDPCGV
jgi:hypothetical protein